MNVITNLETKKCEVNLHIDDYDNISMFMENIDNIKNGGNDPLIDAILEHVEDGYMIDEDQSLWETVDSRDNNVTLSFVIIAVDELEKENNEMMFPNED